MTTAANAELAKDWETDLDKCPKYAGILIRLEFNQHNVILNYNAHLDISEFEKQANQLRGLVIIKTGTRVDTGWLLHGVPETLQSMAVTGWKLIPETLFKGS